MIKIKHFLKDNLSYILGYLFNTLVLILFYTLLNNGQISFIYPLTISLFVLLIILVIRYYNFTSLLANLTNMKNNIDVETKSYIEYKINETTIDIHNKYLSELNVLDHTIKTNRQFYSHWIHNMKTPVSVIDLIIQKGLKQEDNILLKEIDEEKNKLHNQLEQVLHLIRLEDFSKDFLPQKINLKDELKDIINKRKKEFIYNDIYPKIIGDDIKIVTDKKWHRFIINQLISNAIKYSEENKTVIFNIKKVNDEVILEIIDEGIGIPKYDLRRIFEPFFTGVNGREKNNSTGIGLFLVKKVCNRLSHSIEIDSTLGKGTKVEITYKSVRFN